MSDIRARVVRGCDGGTALYFFSDKPGRWASLSVEPGSIRAVLAKEDREVTGAFDVRSVSLKASNLAALLAEMEAFIATPPAAPLSTEESR